jgi:hypothetical protein
MRLLSMLPCEFSLRCERARAKQLPCKASPDVNSAMAHAWKAFTTLR